LRSAFPVLEKDTRYEVSTFAIRNIYTTSKL
jgi:hypothetical protein